MQESKTYFSRPTDPDVRKQILTDIIVEIGDLCIRDSLLVQMLRRYIKLLSILNHSVFYSQKSLNGWKYL